MPDTISNPSIHIVFSTQGRLPLIGKAIRPELFAYLGGIVKATGGAVITVGGTADHVHLVVRLPARAPVADIVRVVKANSSKWMNGRIKISKFGWQRGYGAFSVSQSALPLVIEYVRKQERHHQNRSFEVELAILMAKHEIEVNN